MKQKQCIWAPNKQQLEAITLATQTKTNIINKKLKAKTRKKKHTNYLNK